MCLHPELSLLTYFQILPDPRVARTREHRLIDLLVIAVCTLLCGGEGFNEMEDFGWAKEEWLKTFLELPGGIPSHDAFNRLFQSLDPHSFLECFLRWTQSLRVAVAEEIVALDGKALRRALQAGGTAPVLVSAWARENGLVLGQIKVRAKSNDITAVPELLRALELAGCIVTLDAMGCQKNIAKEIKEADADGRGPVQPSLGSTLATRLIKNGGGCTLLPLFSGGTHKKETGSCLPVSSDGIDES